MNFKKNYIHSFIWALFCVLLFTGIGVSAIGYSEVKGETAYLMYVGLYYAIFLVAIALIMLLYKYLKKPIAAKIDFKKFKLEGIPEMIAVFVVAILAIIARFANVIALFLNKETLGIVKGTEAYFDYANGLLDNLGSSENGAYIYASILRGAFTAFGDNIVVVYVMQSLFAVGAMVLLYFALRKIVPEFIAWSAYILAAFLPGSIQLFLYCTPGLFYTFMLSAYFFGIVYLIDAFRRGKLNDKAVYALYAIAGVFAGFLAFFDISGLILIPVTVYAFFVFKKDEINAKHEKPLTQSFIFGLTAVAVLLFFLFTFSQGIGFGISGIVRYAMLFVPRDGINVTILTPHFGYPDAIALYVFAGLWLLAYLRTKKDKVFPFVLYVVVITLIHFLTMDHVDYGALISLLFVAVAPFGVASLGELVSAADAPAVPVMPFVPELSKGETILSESAVTESTAKPVAVAKSADVASAEVPAAEVPATEKPATVAAEEKKTEEVAAAATAVATEAQTGEEQKAAEAPQENTEHLNTENETAKKEEEKKPDARKLDKEAKRAARMRKKGIIVLGDNPVVTEAVEEVEKQAEEEAFKKKAEVEEKKAKKAAEKEAKKAAKEAAKKEKEAKKAEEAARKAEEAAKKKAEEEAKKAAEEARKAEEAARKAEEEAKRKAEEEARKAEEEAKRKAEEEAKKAAEAEAARIAAEEEAKRKAEEEAKKAAEEEARKAAEAEAARIAAEEEAKRKAEEEAKKAAEEEARKAAEAEAARIAAEEEAKRKAEEAKKVAEEEARKAAEAEAARIAAEEEAKRKAEEAKKVAEEEAKRKAEEEAKKVAEEAAKKAAEEAQAAPAAETPATTGETPVAEEESKEGYSKYTNKKLEPYVPQKLIRSRGRMFNPVAKAPVTEETAETAATVAAAATPAVGVAAVAATAVATASTAPAEVAPAPVEVAPAPVEAVPAPAPVEAASVPVEAVPAPPVDTKAVNEAAKNAEAEAKKASDEVAKKAEEEAKKAADEAAKKAEEEDGKAAEKAAEEAKKAETTRPAAEERKRTDYIKNPLPGPRPHVSRELAFDYDPTDDEMDFDLKDLDGKDFYDI